MDEEEILTVWYRYYRNQQEIHKYITTVLRCCLFLFPPFLFLSFFLKKKHVFDDRKNNICFCWWKTMVRVAPKMSGTRGVNWVNIEATWLIDPLCGYHLSVIGLEQPWMVAYFFCWWKKHMVSAVKLSHPEKSRLPAHHNVWLGPLGMFGISKLVKNPSIWGLYGFNNS